MLRNLLSLFSGPEKCPSSVNWKKGAPSKLRPLRVHTWLRSFVHPYTQRTTISYSATTFQVQRILLLQKSPFPACDRVPKEDVVCVPTQQVFVEENCVCSFWPLCHCGLTGPSSQWQHWQATQRKPWVGVNRIAEEVPLHFWGYLTKPRGSMVKNER